MQIARNEEAVTANRDSFQKMLDSMSAESRGSANAALKLRRCSVCLDRQTAKFRIAEAA